MVRNRLALISKSLSLNLLSTLGKQTGVIYNADLKLHADFINLTSFKARLFDQQVFQLESWALMTLSTTLEKDYESQPHLLNTFISAAAQCVLQAGSMIYKCDKELIFVGPLLEKAREKGSVERWAFWKEKFVTVQYQQDLKDDARALGKQTAERMEKVEREFH